MKVEGWLFLGCGVFFAGADVVYWYTSKEVTGTAALAFAVGLAILTGFYVLFTGRRLPKRPEDDHVGEVEQGTGEIGFFSPHSWWPLWVGLSGATVAVGTPCVFIVTVTGAIAGAYSITTSDIGTSNASTGGGH